MLTSESKYKRNSQMLVNVAIYFYFENRSLAAYFESNDAHVCARNTMDLKPKYSLNYDNYL